MDEDERLEIEKRYQREIHEFVSEKIKELEEETETTSEAFITGWVLIWEGISPNEEKPFCGHLYGPESLTTWNALGLVEWTRRFTMEPGESDFSD